MIKGKDKLEGVHPDLVKVVYRCGLLFPGSFVIIEGTRSAKKAADNLKNGKSQTNRSRHVCVNNKSAMANAVDMAPLLEDGRTIPWKLWSRFEDLNKWMMQAADDVGVKIEWGGNWKTFKDGCHWQLPWKSYP